MSQQHVEDASATIIIFGNTQPHVYAGKRFDDWVRKGYFTPS